MSDWNFLLLAPELTLIALAVGLLIFDILIGKHENRATLLARAAMGGLAVVGGVLALVWNRPGSCLDGSFILDPLAAALKSLFLCSSFLAVFMAEAYQKRFHRGRGEFILLILFATIGMFFVASAGDLLLLFVGLETLSVSLYVMAAYLKDEETSIEAGIKYLIIGALSTAVLLYGLSFVYGFTGTTSLGRIREHLALMPELPAPLLFGMLLVIASLGFKISAVPFHAWAPDVYQGAPMPVTAFLATGSKVAGIAALLRLLTTAFEPAADKLVPVFAGMAVLTLLVGNLGALAQTNVKRLMAYSSVSHAGYLLIGLAAFGGHGAEAVLTYLFGYVAATGGVFLVLIACQPILARNEISDLNGLSKRSPLMAAGMFLALLSLAGVPPLAGFFAKFYLLWAGVEAGYLWLVVIGTVSVILSLYFYLRVVKAMYLEAPASPAPLAVPVSAKILQYAVLLATVVLGIFPAPVVELAARAIASLK